MLTEDKFAIPAAKMAQYRLSAAKRHAEAEHALHARYARASLVAKRAANLLKTVFGAQQVVVFGSLLQPELFHVRSDVDLAVWGIKEQFYYRAVAQLLSLDPEILFDLVRFADAPLPYRQRFCMMESNYEATIHCINWSDQSGAWRHRTRGNAC